MDYLSGAAASEAGSVPEVDELQREAEVAGADEGHDGLEVVFFLAGDADLVVLDGGLDLEGAGFDGPDHGLGGFLLNAVLDFRLALGLAGDRRLHLAPF